MPEAPRQPESYPEYPGIYDLADHAPEGWGARLIREWCMPSDYNRAIRFYERLGMGALMTFSKAMGEAVPLPDSPAMGQGSTRQEGTVRDRLNNQFKVAVVLEGAMGTATVVSGALLTGEAANSFNNPHIVAGAAVVGGLSMALTGAIRYARAQGLAYVDRVLKRGVTLGGDYRNWAGIDGRAMQAFRRAQLAHRAAGGLIEPVAMEDEAPDPWMLSQPTGNAVTADEPAQSGPTPEEISPQCPIRVQTEQRIADLAGKIEDADTKGMDRANMIIARVRLQEMISRCPATGIGGTGFTGECPMAAEASAIREE